MGYYGPDGPWQAVAISVGDFASESPTRNPYSGVWPIIGDVTFLLGGRGGGNYTAQTPERMESIKFRPEPSLYFANTTMASDGQKSADTAWAVGSQLSVHRLLGASDYEGFNFTVKVVEVASWNVTLPNGQVYTPKTGLLGMRAVLESFSANRCTTTCTAEDVADFKSIGLIGSRTFSLHIGSTMGVQQARPSGQQTPLVGQQGSFALGGYEQTRIIGPVGVFDMMDDMPIVFLRDVFLGVDGGHSPFVSRPWMRPITDNISVFYGVPYGNAPSAELNAKLRVGQGMVVVTPSAAAPGIYLPAEVCERISEYLPVLLDRATGYYFWNTTSGFYTSLMRSPGYLGFEFADRSGRNITIKVPFALLDLGLEPPIVPEPTRYFPCHPLYTPPPGGYYLLGRAFLQAAFLGYSLDQNVSYLAQAPGPDVEQSVVRAWRPDDVGAESSLPPGAWHDAWRRSW
ncbi:hypothetical protein QBC39DRAFT_305112, partial [Podospora conica]